MPISSLLTPSYLPICTEKYFFVPLPTLRNVQCVPFPRPRVDGNGSFYT